MTAPTMVPMPPITTISRMSIMMPKESATSGPVYFSQTARSTPASAAMTAAMQKTAVR